MEQTELSSNQPYPVGPVTFRKSVAFLAFTRPNDWHKNASLAEF